ncbi:Nif3-like dinuclear metal center hexameric protein, partial [Staphylococcus pasteuri]
HYSEFVMKQGLKSLLEDWLFEYKDELPIEASDINTDPFTYK